MKMSFTENGYMTSGFEEEIPLLIQLALLCALRKRILDHPKIDYLQVFKLTRVTDQYGDVCQKIVHEQEQPRLQDTYMIVTDEAVDKTVFCIDDGDHFTFLLSEEY